MQWPLQLQDRAGLQRLNPPGPVGKASLIKAALASCEPHSNTSTDCPCYFVQGRAPLQLAEEQALLLYYATAGSPRPVPSSAVLVSTSSMQAGQ